METVLVTGGAGFVGTHLAGALLEEGNRVRVLDSLLPQVHAAGSTPAHLKAEVELLDGDIRDPDVVRKALVGVDRVVHLTARVGVGQSMYELAEYTSVNTFGTAVLLEALLDHRVARLVVASSMSVYGEGLYLDADGSPVVAAGRTRRQLEAGQWDPRDAEGRVLEPVPTPEWKSPSLSSVYALTKFDQEQQCLMVGAAYELPTVALRFFNVYGPHQALSNPYTGVLAIFASRLLNGRRPFIFEDGEQRRDFVSVHDVSRAVLLALRSEAAVGQVLNIGSGESITVNDIAARLGRLLGRPALVPEVSGKYRVGDIRHCFADISCAREVLGYEPRTTIEEGLEELAGWVEGQVAVDRVDTATAELEDRGLAR